MYTTQLVVKYTVWAMVEVINEPFLGFSSLACLNNGEKGKSGELGDLDLSDSNNFSSVSGGFSGRIGAESFLKA